MRVLSLVAILRYSGKEKGHPPPYYPQVVRFSSRSWGLCFLLSRAAGGLCGSPAPPRNLSKVLKGFVGGKDYSRDSAVEPARRRSTPRLPNPRKPAAGDPVSRSRV
jgi:hypothetical protein